MNTTDECFTLLTDALYSIIPLALSFKSLQTADSMDAMVQQ